MKDINEWNFIHGESGIRGMGDYAGCTFLTVNVGQYGPYGAGVFRG